MPADVGEAVAAYLRQGRPASAQGRTVFVRILAPHRALTSGGVTQIVAAAARRAGLGQIHAHRLRHTAATQMLRAGASLPEIGQLLRHRRAMTTAIYAKVNRDALRTIARPWPGDARMNTLRQALADYLAVRRALGYKLARAEKLLAQFLDYVEDRGEDHDHHRGGPCLGDASPGGPSELGIHPAFRRSPLCRSSARDRPRNRGAGGGLAAGAEPPGHALPLLGGGHRRPDRRRPRPCARHIGWRPTGH